MLTMSKFGRKVKMPSTRAIKHQIMQLMLQDLLKAEALERGAMEGVDAKGPAASLGHRDAGPPFNR